VSVTGAAVPHLLVVAATHAEAAHVPAGVEVVVTGIGKTAAAVATTRALTRRAQAGQAAHAGQAAPGGGAGGGLAGLTVVNLGTAGALRDGLAGLHEVGTVLNHDMNADAVRALGYDPQELLRLSEAPVVLASGDLFVTDPAVRERLAERAHLVDMEGYAVAYACRALGVDVRVVKHVSDNADETALDWPAMVDRSARALAEWLRLLL
jgi:adenosylhomocysteine nucleosidase